MPLAFLKIEGEFVRDMARDEVAVALVRAINDVGHVMGLETIAEYVEDERLLQMVRDLGVDYFQGFVFARPQPLDEAFRLCTAEGEWIREHGHRRQ
jgi:EAL domain-containing protein (putative c-di-GMP-specific phosphodiesterase class I)